MEAQHGHRLQHPISVSPTSACCCCMRISAPPGRDPGPKEGELWVGSQAPRRVSCGSSQGVMGWGTVYLPHQ